MKYYENNLQYVLDFTGDWLTQCNILIDPVLLRGMNFIGIK